MKRTINYLAPYLPYELKGVTQKQIGLLPSGSVVELYTCNIDHFIDGEIKPILLPLSYLLIPEYALFTGIYSDLNKVIINNHYKKWGVWEYEELLKNHYDVFELIENNLAVDINSIK